MNRYKFYLLLIFCVFILIVSTEVRSAPKFDRGHGPPEAVELAIEIRKKPITDHGSIYKKIKDDTTVLDREPLQKSMVHTCIKEWYGKYIRGDQLESVEKVFPLDRETNKAFSLFRELISRLDAEQDTIECWMKIMSSSPVFSKTADHRMIRKMKLNGGLSLKVLLRNAGYEKNNNSDNEEFRKLSNFGDLPQVIYEMNRLVWSGLNTGLRKRMKKFARKILMGRNGIGGWKQFSVTFLYDLGTSKTEIKNKLFVNDNNIPGGGGIPAKRVKELFIEDINRWINDYPEWPVDKKNNAS